MNEESAYREAKNRIRSNLLKFTRQAFAVLPPLDKPRILDIGCGEGIPTLELARLSNGEITGIDIDEKALEELSREADKSGLAERVKALNCSVTDMKFPEESFDIIWSEGSIFTIGFKEGLREWKWLLRRGGFMIVHDEEGNLRKKLKTVKDSGLQLLEYIVLDRDTWWREYYHPLQQLISETLSQSVDKEKIPEAASRDKKEIEWFDSSPGRNSSVYFIMQNT